MGIEVGQAILPVDPLSSGSSRLIGGCGQDWPPHRLSGYYSKYPPAEPGALGFEPLKAAAGSLTRPRAVRWIVIQSKEAPLFRVCDAR